MNPLGLVKKSGLLQNWLEQGWANPPGANTARRGPEYGPRSSFFNTISVIMMWFV